MLRASNICLWLGALCLAAGAFGQSYVGIGVLDCFNGFLARDTVPTSINKQGEIAGICVDSLSDGNHGFVRAANGTITSFDVPAILPEGRFAFSINDAGAITGYDLEFFSPPPTQHAHGYVRDPFGNFTTFDPPGSISTMPQSINTRGFIAGFYNESNLLIHGYVRDPFGNFTTFDPPGSISSKPVSINFDGAIAGFYNESNLLIHGFVRKPDGEIISFDPPGSTGTIVAGINNAGAITGYYTVANGRAFGFVRHPDGKFTSFDPGANTFPHSINNKGAITGSYTDNAGNHGFVRAADGTITSFDPPVSICGPLAPSTIAASINDDGVITGSCKPMGVPITTVGWVRFP